MTQEQQLKAIKQEVLQRELSRIASKDGVLRPERIVDVARDPKHPLHNCFEWDDSKAGEAYRLVQAQALIRYVKISITTPEEKIVVVRMFESLPSDRKDGTGYRSIQSIMSDKDKYQELLKSALAELESFRVRYRHLVELAPLIQEIQRTVDKQSARATRRTRKSRGAQPKQRRSAPRRESRT